MLNIQEYLTKISPKLTIEYLQNSFIVGIVLLILIVVAFALNRPVSNIHYEEVNKFAQQHRFEQTQKMATQLLQKEKVKNIEFYRLLNAYEYEKSKIKQYPAIVVDQ